ncbi:MAG: M48 family metallopeptidase [Lachnospiraceae bacterium]|nr:M48 family metallopeptidase [Lachnospiraceae bacterium]
MIGFKVFIIVFYVMMKAFEAYIQYLDDSYADKELPENVRDVYNAEEYATHRKYQEESGKLDLVEEIVEIAYTLAFFIFNGYAWLFSCFSGMNVYVQYLAVIAIFTLISAVIKLPFEYYDTFVIEEKYGLNTSTRKTFLLDTIKSVVLAIPITYFVIVGIMLLFVKFGNAAIVIGTIATLLLVLILMLIIIPIMRIYNKFTPIEEGELKDKLLKLCDKYGVTVRKIVVKDASKRTTKANAFCTGFGKRKTISLDDNLVNGFTEDEIVAVFAHEFAHAKYKHTMKSLPLMIVSLMLVFASLAIVLNVPQFYLSFGFNDINYLFAHQIVNVCLWPLSTLISVISNYFSRKREYEADAFAAREGYGADLIAALKKLHKEAESDINPHPAMVFIEYSHPTLSQRITAIEAESV